jgi:shikimate 5-dehydrogenase
LFDHTKLTAGRRVLINGAGGAVGGYAVRLAKNAVAYVIATASPRSQGRVKAAGADELIDHTTTVADAACPGRRGAQPRADRTGSADRTARRDPAGRSPGEHRTQPLQARDFRFHIIGVEVQMDPGSPSPQLLHKEGEAFCVR